MSLRSFDGENGFSGELDVNVTYQLTGDNKLMVTYAAITKQRPVPINLSSKIFFNLAGEVSKQCLHFKQLHYCSYYHCYF